MTAKPGPPRSTRAERVTWSTIEAVIAQRWRGVRSDRVGDTRYYRLPSPTGGALVVEITLRPRWCSMTIDRWPTTDRDTELAGPWLEWNVWPVVQRAAAVSARGVGIMPVGSPAYSGAYPIARGDLVDVLILWVDAELTWGLPRRADVLALRADPAAGGVPPVPSPRAPIGSVWP